MAESMNNSDVPLFFCQPELLSLYEALPNVMFCAKGSDGRYVAANSAFVRRTGKRSKREVIGTVSSDHFVAELAARYDDQDALVFERGEALRDELELIKRTNGELGWYHTTKLPVAGVGGDIVGLVSVSRDLLTPSDENIEIGGLQNIVSYVRSHLDEPLRAGDLATVATCSAAQLNRRMQRVFGMSATQYVLGVRVQTASELLANTDSSIAVIAAACGFYDQASFTHRFARLTNATPAQFRAAHQEK